MVDLQRYHRYQEKIIFCKERIKVSENWLTETNDLKTQLAIYKASQEVIEGIVDIIAMIIKDENKVPDDDYSNFDKIQELKVIDNTHKETLVEANGLRNRLVHDYNSLDDKIALASLRRLLPQLKNIIREVETWIKQNYNE